MTRASTRRSLLKVRQSVEHLCRTKGEGFLRWLRRERGSFARFERRVEALERKLRESRREQPS
jgi:hypothetical protein